MYIIPARMDGAVFMLQSIWSRLCRRRSLLPTRDIFDADLDRARRKPG